jgi:predicted AlkP superfamily phosphohydrolase/phosphomutase
VELLDRGTARVLSGLALLLFLLLPARAFAYIGPGAGFAFLGSFFVFFVTFIIAFFALLAWPVRYLMRLRRRTAKPGSERKIQKAVVIGFDGMEPTLVERFMDQGHLPNFSALRDLGAYRRLESTLPPLSPVAWSSFQTGVNPGKHAIFDFLQRNPKNYLGELSSARIEPNPRNLRVGPIQIPLGRPSIRQLRKSQPFWKLLGDNGIFSMILRVPITFPPEPFAGMSLSAMCAPDLRGTQGTFSYYTTRNGSQGEKTGGEVIPVAWQGDLIRTWIVGPAHPFRAQGAAIKAPLHLKKNGQSVELRVNGERHVLKPGEYTPWVPVSFRADLIKIRGIVRFCLRQVEPFLDLYMSAVQIDPGTPSLPISHPSAFAIYLAKKQGPFATLGLAEDTWALNEGVLDDAAFWKQCCDIHQEREQMFWDALEHVRSGLLVCVFDITDRAQHMFWRYEDPRHPLHPRERSPDLEDPLLQTYRMADDLIGKLRQRLGENTLLAVISDHGFRSFRRCVSLNAWLHRNGFLALREGEPPGDWFRGVDWSRTRAFALGLAGIYLNLKGRERSGIVAPGEEADEIRQKIIDGLKGIQDPETGETAVFDVVDTRTAYRGPYAANAPDLIIAYGEGYRHAWESTVGKVTEEVFTDNRKSWSGDHCLRPDQVPGVFFSNWKLESNRPRLMDLAPTILKAFGVTPPEYMDGAALEVSPGGTPDGKDQDRG